MCFGHVILLFWIRSFSFHARFFMRAAQFQERCTCVAATSNPYHPHCPSPPPTKTRHILGVSAKPYAIHISSVSRALFSSSNFQSTVRRHFSPTTNALPKLLGCFALARHGGTAKKAQEKTYNHAHVPKKQSAPQRNDGRQKTSGQAK